MMEDFDEVLYDKIEDYLRGRLPAEDATRFELEMKSDDALRELVNLHRLEYEERELMIRQKVREQVKDWVNLQDPPTVAPKGKKWWTLLGVFFMLLFVALLWIQYAPSLNQPSTGPEDAGPEKLKNDSIPAIEETIDTNSPKSAPTEQNHTKRSYAILQLVQKTASKYKKRDLEETSFRDNNTPQSVIVKYADLEPKNPDYESSRLELGQAYMHTGNNTQAIKIFRYILSHQPPESDNYKQAQWYLVLTLSDDYLTNNAEVKKNLNDISKQEDHIYRGDAVDFLKVFKAGN